MDPKVQKSLDQMRSFIIQEAKEKAEEIRSKADEDFYVEKNTLLESEKEKIRKEYSRKQSQISVKRRIEISNRTNSILLELQKRRNEMLQILLDKAKLAAAARTKDTQKYKVLLTNLIAQGLTELMESQVTILCRKEDVAIVRDVLDAAVKKAVEAAKPRPLSVTLTISETQFLPPGPSGKGEGEFCAGGVILTCLDGRIRLNNTIEARLAIAYEMLLPKMKHILFPDKLQNIF